MNKLDKLQIATILLDIESLFTGNVANNISSTTSNLMANVEKDGFDQEDMAKLALDQSFDQDPQGVMQKIQNNVGLHYDQIKSALKERGDGNGLIALESMMTKNPDFETFGNSLLGLLQKWTKHKEGGEIESGDDVVIVDIAGKTYRLIVAESEEEKEQGLMEVEELGSDEGMLFDYRDDVQEEISFWMKDTYIPLDIIFVDESNTVISVKQGVPESEEALVEYNVAYVIEVNQNSGIKSGDLVKFKSKLNEQDNEVEETEESETEGVLEIIGSDGEVQAQLQGSERIFSIKNTKTLVSMAKRAYESQSDSDYKALGRKIFEYMKVQDEREPEYVSEN